MLFLSVTEAMLWPQLRKLAPGQSVALSCGAILGRDEDGRAFLGGTVGVLQTGPSSDPCGPWCQVGYPESAAS
jgi:hypothetical protein